MPVPVREDDGWSTTDRLMERGGIVSTGITGGGGTRASTRRGRRFSFPPTLLLLGNAAGFFHASADMPPSPSLSLPGEPLSTAREKPFVNAKVNAVDADAGRRLDGSRCRAAAAAAGSRLPSVSRRCSWMAVMVVRPCPSCLVNSRSCLICVDAGGGARYCMLTSTLFFASGGLGVPVLLRRDDASLCSGAGPDHGILDCGGAASARRGPNSGTIRRLPSAAVVCCCGTRRTACATRPLLYDDASSGDGTRRAILEAVLSLDASTPGWRLLEDGRGLGSSDLRCWREVDERVIGSERGRAFSSV